MNNANRSSWMWLLLVTIAAVGSQANAEDPRPTRDRRVTNSQAMQGQRYRKTWALIVGIDDYTNPARSDAERVYLRKLNNAEKDATDVRDLLVKHYGYTPDHTFLLRGADATYQAILDRLTAFNDENEITKDDSLFIYFAGHGVRLDGDTSERGALYPFDVQLSNGRPIGRYVGLHTDLLNKLKKSPARHKLIVLDSCHSGEIFSLEARPRSETDNRQQAQLFSQPTIQAIASCRASQLASDGQNDANSPFTGAFLRALMHLPARELGADKSPIWTNKLFGYMRSELTSLPNEQSPDCRCLTSDDGEFYFFPRGEFAPYATHLTEFRMLQAMVPGEHGNWWFDETPWFMPSLRRMILDELERDNKDRSSAESQAVTADKLRELTDRAILDMRGSKDPLVRMRLRHLETLLRGQNRNELKRRVEEIAAELAAMPTESTEVKLDATDIHFLAATQHSLGQEGAFDNYRLALKEYAGNDDPKRTLPQDALKALCHADLGHYLLESKGDCMAAAKEFQLALAPFGKLAPAAFRVYVLCREADAWQRLNRWGEADRKLLTALDVANNFDTEHGLTAFTHRRRAWALMEQWKITEAAKAFEKANEILLSRAQVSPSQEGGGDLATSPEEAIVLSGDFDALIAYLHNLHGLAMVKRFQGDEIGAGQEYRELTRKVSSALTKLRQDSLAARTASDVEVRLVERLINSQERLGDVNLFGHPDLRDVKEAVDDYRRALGACHLLPAHRRDRIRAGLLFKHALALSIPSPIQDPELARAFAKEANDVHKRFEAGTTEVLRTFSVLTPAVVNLLSPESTASETNATAVAALREALQSLRDRGGQNLHRDQLEVLLFASRSLVDQLPKDDRFHLASDADLLLSFCRQTLPKQINAAMTATLSNRQETRAYLRPYYDSILRNKLRIEQKHVKDLLEIQWEATRGEFFLKPKHSTPTLALYVLDAKCYLFLDVPRGASKQFCLENDCTLDELRVACINGPKLTLPREILREFDKLRGDKSLASQESGMVEIACWWEDPVQGIGSDAAAFSMAVGSNRLATTTVFRPTLPGSFPFLLPPFVRLAGVAAGAKPVLSESFYAQPQAPASGERPAPAAGR